MNRIQFRLDIDTLATYADNGQDDHLLIIPAGAKLELLDETLSAPSVRVRWDGRDVAVFSEALRACAREAGQTNPMGDNMAINETDEVEEDLSSAEKLQLVDQLLLLSERCWSRTLRSCHSDLTQMRERLLEESGSEGVFKAAAG